MKIVALQTLSLAEHPDYLWVQVETDDGIVGTGETMPRTGPVQRVVHDVLAPIVLGADLAPEALWQRCFQALNYHGHAGAEFRALSALDIALWDALGQQAGQPVHRLLGGPCRDRIPVYNTCVGWGELDDHTRFRTDPAGLARDLVGDGYPAMKIWPFDELSVPTLGQRIGPADLARGAAPFAAIRDALGDRIDVALEGHSCWSLPAAIAIARALEPLRPMWLEDMLPVGNVEAWASLRRATSIPILGSERAFGRYAIAPFLQQDAVDIVKQDVGWCGGLTEFVKVAALCDLYERPITPHNCLGPIGAMASVHAAAAVPNLFLMESIRAFSIGFFAALADGAPVVEGGTIDVPERPGLGVRLRDDVVARAARERSALDQVRVAGWSAGDPWTAR